ncbi:MAG: PEP-CTERM sorting domain-containing protein [Pirellulales bacterium]
MRVSSLVLAWMICPLLGGAAHAAFITPSGWTRPVDDTAASSTLTTFQHWDVLGSSGDDPALPKAADVAKINPNGAATVRDSSSPASGAFITSGGNIYSFSGVITPEAIVPGYAAAGYRTEFLVQLRTQGQNIDTADLTLGGVPVSSLAGFSYTELSNVDLGGFGGFLIDHAWTFTAPADLASFTLDWGWGASSASFDQLAIDTHLIPVPEPASLAMAGLASLGIALVVGRTRGNRSRRRQAAS